MKRQFRTVRPLSLHCPSTILSKLEPVVGLAPQHGCVPPATNSKQFNRLRSFPSEIRVLALFEKSNMPTPSPEEEALQKAIDAKAPNAELKAALEMFVESRKQKQAKLE